METLKKVGVLGERIQTLLVLVIATICYILATSAGADPKDVLMTVMALGFIAIVAMEYFRSRGQEWYRGLKVYHKLLYLLLMVFLAAVATWAIMTLVPMIPI